MLMVFSPSRLSASTGVGCCSLLGRYLEASVLRFLFCRDFSANPHVIHLHQHPINSMFDCSKLTFWQLKTASSNILNSHNNLCCRQLHQYTQILHVAFGTSRATKFFRFSAQVSQSKRRYSLAEPNGLAQNQCSFTNKGKNMAYKTFKRSCKSFEQMVNARKFTVSKGLTYEQAREQCKQFNEHRTAAQIRKGTKMEFTEQ